MGLAQSCQGDNPRETETYAKVQKIGNQFVVSVENQENQQQQDTFQQIPSKAAPISNRNLRHLNSLNGLIEYNQQQYAGIQLAQAERKELNKSPNNPYQQKYEQYQKIQKQDLIQSDIKQFELQHNNNNIQIQQQQQQQQQYLQQQQEQFQQNQIDLTESQNQKIGKEFLKKSMVESYQGAHQISHIPSQRNEKVIDSQRFVNSAEDLFLEDNASLQEQLKQSTQTEPQLPYVKPEPDEPYFAKEVYEDGSQYQGYKVNDKRHGKGTFLYSQGGKFIGEWKQDRINGKGTLYYPNNQKAYEGEWKDDQFCGQGIVYNENQLQDSNKEVQFSYENFDRLGENWIRYEGYFKKDFKDGLGTLYISNGDIYVGKFSFDYVHGKGSYKKKNGETIYGEWRINKLINEFK